MAYVELEQFLGRGEEKVAWLVSYNHVVGMLLGGFVGRTLGVILDVSAGWMLLGSVLGAMLGIWLATQYHGLRVGRRLTIRLRFYVRRSRGPQRINAAVLYDSPTTRPVLVRVRQQTGAPVVLPRRSLVEREP